MPVRPQWKCASKFYFVRLFSNRSRGRNASILDSGLLDFWVDGLHVEYHDIVVLDRDCNHRFAGIDAIETTYALCILPYTFTLLSPNYRNGVELSPTTYRSIADRSRTDFNYAEALTGIIESPVYKGGTRVGWRSLVWYVHLLQLNAKKGSTGPLYHGKRWYGPCSDASFAQSRNPGMVFMFTVERWDAND